MKTDQLNEFKEGTSFTCRWRSSHSPPDSPPPTYKHYMYESQQEVKKKKKTQIHFSEKMHLICFCSPPFPAASSCLCLFSMTWSSFITPPLYAPSQGKKVSGLTEKLCSNGLHSRRKVYSSVNDSNGSKHSDYCNCSYGGAVAMVTSLFISHLFSPPHPVHYCFVSGCPSHYRLLEFEQTSLFKVLFRTTVHVSSLFSLQHHQLCRFFLVMCKFCSTSGGMILNDTRHGPRFRPLTLIATSILSLVGLRL